MRILTILHNTDEYGVEDVENALVNLTPELARTIYQRINTFNAIKKIHPELLELSFESNSGECGFYPYSSFNHEYSLEDDVLDVECLEKLNVQGWVEIPDPKKAKPLEMAKTYMMIQSDGVYWEAYLDHSPVTWDSELLEVAIIEKALETLQPSG